MWTLNVTELIHAHGIAHHTQIVHSIMIHDFDIGIYLIPNTDIRM